MPDLVTTADSALEQITRVIVERFDPERVLLFGSRARGDARADSDYDLMVVMDTDVSPYDCKTAICAAFPDRTWSMDVVVLTPAKFERQRDDVGRLAYAAVRDGQTLYLRPGSREPDSPSPRVREKPSGPPESLRDWVERAENDLRALERLLDDPSPVCDAACFHAHQGVEKLLKSILVARHMPPPRMHELAELLAMCPLDLRADESIVSACALLQGQWEASRYPGDHPAPSLRDAMAAGSAARAVRERVRALRLTS